MKFYWILFLLLFCRVAAAESMVSGRRVLSARDMLAHFRNLERLHFNSNPDTEAPALTGFSLAELESLRMSPDLDVGEQHGLQRLLSVSEIKKLSTGNVVPGEMMMEMGGQVDRISPERIQILRHALNLFSPREWQGIYPSAAKLVLESLFEGGNRQVYRSALDVKFADKPNDWMPFLKKTNITNSKFLANDCLLVPFGEFYRPIVKAGLFKFFPNQPQASGNAAELAGYVVFPNIEEIRKVTYDRSGLKFIFQQDLLSKEKDGELDAKLGYLRLIAAEIIPIDDMHDIYQHWLALLIMGREAKVFSRIAQRALELNDRAFMIQVSMAIHDAADPLVSFSRDGFEQKIKTRISNDSSLLDWYERERPFDDLWADGTDR